MNLPELMTVKEVAEYLHCDRTTVYDRIDDGTLKAHKLPNSNRWLILASSVSGWFEQPKKRKVSSRVIQAELAHAREIRTAERLAWRARRGLQRKTELSEASCGREA